MRRSTPFWRLAPGAALILLYTGSSMAFTLGRPQGVAVVGRPLDVTIQASLDGMRDGDLCADADVFYGDTRMEARRVEVQQSGNIARVRVRVAMPVNEPFVTVDVRVGCTERLSRNYVLLVESPVEAAQPAPPPPVAVAPPAPAPGEPVTRPVDAGQVVQAPSVAAAPVARASRPPVRPSRSEAAAPVRPAPRRVARAAAAPAPAAAPKVERPTLKLDAVEIASGPAGLKATPSLQSAPAASSAQRAEAAAQWQALNAQPDDLLRTSQRMQSLEGDIKAMRESMLKNNAMLTDLRGRLEQAERERYSNGLVYALAGLLAAASALAAFLWHRGRRAHPANSSWWMDRSAPAQPQLHKDEPAIAPTVAARARPEATAAALAGVAGAAAVVAARPATAAPAPVVTLSQAAPRTVPPVYASPRVTRPGGIDGRVSEDAIKLDELSDIQQQADFFVSLGEHERAIGVLRNHIDAHPQGSAVAWLDLLDIYHRLRREDDYEQLRRDFEWLFNAKVPSYGEYHEDNSGLETHSGRLSQIQSLWGSPEVLDVINDAVLRRPVQDESEPLGLEAYRDLLMLHDIASDLQGAAPEDGEIALATPIAAAVAPAPATPAIKPPQGTQWDELGTGVRELALAPSEFDRLMPQTARRAPPPAAPLAAPAPVASAAAERDLDFNLDDLQVPELPPDVPPPASAPASSAHDGNLLDFDLGLNEEFKKAGEKP